MSRNRVLIVSAMIGVLLAGTLTPAPAEAGLGQFFRWVGQQLERTPRRVGRAAQFVVEVPGKLEYRMREAGVPPVVAVIGTNWLSTRMLSNRDVARLFRRSSQIVKIKRNVEELDKIRDALRGYYKNQAKELDASATRLIDTQSGLSKRLVRGEFDFDTFVQRWLTIEVLAAEQLKLAMRLEQRAQRLDRGAIINLTRNLAVDKVFRGAVKVGTGTLAEELLKTMDPRVVQLGLADRITVDTLVANIVARDVDRNVGLLGPRQKLDVKAITERVQRAVREQVKKDRSFLKKNYRSFVSAAVMAEVERAKLGVGFLKAELEAEPVKGDAPLTVQFDASASKGQIENYELDFGDGTEHGTGSKAAHIYTKDGTYQATVTVTGKLDLQSRSDPVVITVEPGPEPPSVTLSLEPDEVSPGGKVMIGVTVDQGSIQNGTLTVTLRVGDTTLEPKVFEGELGYDSEFTRVYSVPENARPGRREVQATPTSVPDEFVSGSDAKGKLVGETATASFEVVAGETSSSGGDDAPVTAVPQDPFAGTWSGISRITQHSGMTLDEIRDEAGTLVSPVRITISRSGGTYRVSGLGTLQVDDVAVSGRRITIKASQLDTLVMKPDRERIELTLSDDGSVLEGTHRIDFAALDDTPAALREYQVNEVRLTRQTP